LNSIQPSILLVLKGGHTVNTLKAYRKVLET